MDRSDLTPSAAQAEMVDLPGTPPAIVAQHAPIASEDRARIDDAGKQAGDAPASAPAGASSTPPQADTVSVATELDASPFAAGLLPELPEPSMPPISAKAIDLMALTPGEVVGPGQAEALVSALEMLAPKALGSSRPKLINTSRLRKSCDLCHEGRLRCVMTANGKCEQCIMRGFKNCIMRAEKKRGRPRLTEEDIAERSARHNSSGPSKSRGKAPKEPDQFDYIGQASSYYYASPNYPGGSAMGMPMGMPTSMPGIQMQSPVAYPPYYPYSGYPAMSPHGMPQPMMPVGMSMQAGQYPGAYPQLPQYVRVPQHVMPDGSVQVCAMAQPAEAQMSPHMPQMMPVQHLVPVEEVELAPASMDGMMGGTIAEG
jgi:hypothetical protein